MGGIKEKVLAAHRACLNTILLPTRNEPDLEDIPEEIRKSMKFVFIDTIDEALAVALKKAPAGQRQKKEKKG